MICERCGKSREYKEDVLCSKCRNLWIYYLEEHGQKDFRKTTMSHEKFIVTIWDEFIAEFAAKVKEVVQFT